MVKIKPFNSAIRYWLFALCTALMVFICWMFYINEYVSHPQFENFDHFNACLDLISSENKKSWYKAFFYIDFIWAFLVLASSYQIISQINKGTRKRSLWIFLFFGSLAYAFDSLENLLYLFENPSILKTVVLLKEAAYAVVFIVLIYNIYKRYLQHKNRNIYFFLKTSSFSILIILVITILITMVDQGGTILVELLSDWHQIAFTFFLLNFLVIIISHYPIYMQIWNVLDKPFTSDGLRLLMAKKSAVILGFGIIYFIPKNDMEYDPFVTRLLRRSLGIFLYMSMFYVVLFVAVKYFEWQVNALIIAALITSILLIFFFVIERKKKRFEDVLYGECTGDKYENARKLTRMLQWYPQVLLTGLLSVVIAAVVSAYHEWSRVTVLVILAVLFLNNLSYIYFRLSRPYLRYIFHSDSLEKSNPGLINRDILKCFQERNKPNYILFNKLIFKIGQKLAYLSDNRRYLNYMRIGGLISLFVIIFINLRPLDGFRFNPLNVILLYIILYYSVIIIFLKHMLFYSKTIVPVNTEPPFASFSFYQPIFKYLFPVLMLVLLVWGFYSTSLDNDLHTLTLVKENKEMATSKGVLNTPVLVDIETFVDGFDPVVKKDTVHTFFVASYGGGLKANLWNLLIFNKLNEIPGFFKNTLCLSGVSGGAIGIGNFVRIHENFPTYQKRTTANIVVGESNLLSTEITYLLGADFIRRYIPVDRIFHDRGRSYYSMKQHAQHTGGLANFNTVSFRTKWSEVYRNNGYFPALIINSTSTKGKQGIALSVFTKDKIVPASDDILLFNEPNDQLSLTYYGALSTSNRFPFVSPAAKVEGKGYYLDGGYFENSGLLSAREFRNYIIPKIRTGKKADSVRINAVFVNIVNSKEYYTLSKIKDWKIHLKDDNGLASGQLSTILSTLVSTEKLPRYITESLERDENQQVVKIMMPHKLDYKYVTTILGGEPKHPLRLIELIKKHNRCIDDALKAYDEYKFEKWGVVTPPLSRLLGKVAVKYQEAMVNEHHEVKQQIKNLQNLVTPE